MKFGQFHSKASEYDAGFSEQDRDEWVLNLRIEERSDFGKQQRSYSGFGQRFLMVMDSLAFQWIGGNFRGYGYCLHRNLDAWVSGDLDVPFLLIQRCEKFNIRLNLFGFFAASFDKWKKIKDKRTNPPVSDSVKGSSNAHPRFAGNGTIIVSQLRGLPVDIVIHRFKTGYENERTTSPSGGWG